MAVASSRPIQIGKVLSPSTSFKITIGPLVKGSMVKPEIIIGLNILTSNYRSKLILTICNNLSILENRIIPI
jgi:hypothetical protein